MNITVVALSFSEEPPPPYAPCQKTPICDCTQLFCRMECQGGRHRKQMRSKAQHQVNGPSTSCLSVDELRDFWLQAACTATTAKSLLVKAVASLVDA